MKLGSLETVSGNVYYSMDGGTSYQQPGPCVYSITAQTTLVFRFLQLVTLVTGLANLPIPPPAIL